MGSAATIAELAAVGAGIAVVIGVVALLTSAEVAKRLQALVDQKLNEADVKLSEALAHQDQRIMTLRQYMSQLAEDNETAIRSMGKDVKEIKSCIALMSEALSRMEGQDGNGAGQNGPDRKRVSRG